MNHKQSCIVMVICVTIGISILLIGQDSFHKEISTCHSSKDPCFQESVNIGMISIMGAIFAWASIPFIILLTNHEKPNFAEVDS